MNNNYCPIHDSECKYEERKSPSPQCFVAIPYDKAWGDARKTINKVLRKNDVKIAIAEEEITTARHLLCKVCKMIKQSDFGIVEVSRLNLNVMLELRIIIGSRKPTFILYNKSLEKDEDKFPSDIVALDRIEYYDQETLENKLSNGISRFLEKINLEERSLDTLIDTTKSYAKIGNLSETDRLAKSLHNQIIIGKTPDYYEKYIKMLEEIATIYLNAGKNGKNIQYNLAAMKTMILIGKKFSNINNKFKEII